MTENQIKNQLFQALVRQGYLALKINSGATKGIYKTRTGQTRERLFWFASWRILGLLLQRAGVADLLAVQPPAGRFVAIEVKRPGKEANLSDGQKQFKAAVESVGGIYLIASSTDDLSSLFGSTD